VGRINKSQLRRAVRGALGPFVISTLESAASRRSWEQSQALARKLGSAGFRLDRRHRALALEQLGYAFGQEKDARQLRDITRGCFQHLTMLFMEALRMPSMSPEELCAVARIEGIEHLQNALAAGKGAVIFCGHFGNWEVGAVRLIYEGLPVIPLSRAARSPRLAKAITAIRQRLDFPVIPISEGARGILRALKANQIVPIMSDRFARGDGVTVTFFDRPTHVWHTPAIMAQRTGCPVIPTHAIRQPDGQYIVRVDPPLELAQSDNRDRDLHVTTARIMALLEGLIREYPEQYTWPYRLWRPEFPIPDPWTQDDGA
jgi:KDO2-lipid IV(A) lauroyltransferase